MKNSKKLLHIGDNSENKPAGNGKFVRAIKTSWFKIGNGKFDLTPDIQNAIPIPKYNINNLNEDDTQISNNILETVHVDPSNVKPGKKSLQTKSIKNILQKRVDKNLNQPLSLITSKPNVFGGDLINTTILSNVTINWTRLEV